MAGYLLRRFILMLITLVIVSIMIFGASRYSGDPRAVMMRPGVTVEQYEAWGREMGLDKPLPVQYVVWAGKVLRGDFGVGVMQHRPVWNIIMERLPATVQLGITSTIFALVGVPLGVLSAVRRGSVMDYVGRIFAIMGQALPPFWIGLVMILIFSVQLDWLPAAKKSGALSFIMPTITLGWFGAAGLVRLVRSSMLDVLDEEYIKLARAKGVSRQAIIWKHAFKNAMIVPLTYGGLLLGGIFVGAVVTEAVFGWPGVGRLTIDAVLQNDFPVLSALTMIFTAMFIGANLLVDLLHVYIDRRVQLT